MADKLSKKVGILIKRERTPESRVIATTGFKLRFDKVTGLLDVFLEVAGGQRGERVVLDPTILLSNLDSFKKYSASLVSEQDDAAQKEDILVSEHSLFANIVHFSNLGVRAETVFGVFSFHDWVEASRSDGGQKQQISSFDSLAVFSSSGVQKKLLLEMMMLLGQLAKER
jgi:hypothetical protein